MTLTADLEQFWAEPARPLSSGTVVKRDWRHPGRYWWQCPSCKTHRVGFGDRGSASNNFTRHYLARHTPARPA